MNKNSISRRSFLSKSVKGAAFAGAGGFSLFIKGCSKTQDFDLLISGADVYDGLGNPAKKVDVAVKDSRILFIGEQINKKRAKKVIEAQHLALAPGFIDVHTHTDVELLVNPKGENYIRQGVTTQISGNCGSSRFPIADEIFQEKKDLLKEEYGLDLDWNDINGFFRRFEEKPIANNYATLLGQGALRGKVVGYNDQQPTDAQVDEMKKIVVDNIKAGALGLSTGLEYAPSSYAKTDEIIELCHEVAKSGGIYATHMRDEGDDVLEAIDEALAVARATKVSLQISHLKTGYPANWPKIETALSKIENANKEGLEVSADRYPYIACATGLDLYFPLWARQGTTQDFIDRLKNPEFENKIRDYSNQQEQRLGSWDKVLISSVSTEKNKKYEGKNILAAATESGKDPYDFMRDLIIEEKNRVEMVSFMMCEDNLKRILTHPLVMVASDGWGAAPYGILSNGKPHPRLYGTFPRVLGKYARDEQTLALPLAIQKMTSMPAKKFKLKDRGVITAGAFADLVIFDPEKIIDSATWADPHQYPNGIDYVIVNGRIVIVQGEHTGNLPGKILKKSTA